MTQQINFNFEPIYILHGSEQFLTNQFINELINSFKTTNNLDQNIKTFDCNTDNFIDVLNYTSIISLVGKQLIIVKNIQNVKGLTNKKTLEFIEKYVKNPNPENVLVLCSDKLLPATNTLLKLFSKCKIVRFNQLKNFEITDFIKDNIGKNSKITPEAISLFRLYVGDDLNALSQEVGKLIQYNHFDTIDEKIISEYISIQRQYNPFELLNAIIERDKRLLQTILNQFQSDLDIDAIPIVALLYSFFTKLLMMYNDKACQEIYYQKFYQNAYKSFSLDSVEKIMYMLLEADLQLKAVTTVLGSQKDILVNLISEIIK